MYTSRLMQNCVGLIGTMYHPELMRRTELYQTYIEMAECGTRRTNNAPERNRVGLSCSGAIASYSVPHSQLARMKHTSWSMLGMSTFIAPFTRRVATQNALDTAACT